MFSEDDELARPAVGVDRQRLVLQDSAQLGPLTVCAGVADLLGNRRQLCQFEDFGVEFLDGLGSGGSVEQFLFEFFNLFGVVIVGVEALEVDVGLFVGVGAVEDFQLLTLQALGASHEAPVDGFRTGRQATLQHGEGETDGVLAFATDPVGTIHPFSHVVGDLRVQRVLQLRELVGHGLGAALGEELLALEGQQVLLDHSTHDAVGVGGLGVLAFEAVAVEQRKEELKVFFLARVWCRGHQQQMSCDAPEHFTEQEAFRFLQLAAEVVGTHTVRLVDDNEVPLGLPELGLQLLVAR